MTNRKGLPIFLCLAVHGPGSAQYTITTMDGNGDSAANPAVDGSIVSIYTTEEGQTVPIGIDGNSGGRDNARKASSLTADRRGREQSAGDNRSAVGGAANRVGSTK